MYVCTHLLHKTSVSFAVPNLLKIIICGCGHSCYVVSSGTKIVMEKDLE
jgi:hypothetical protein